MRRIAAIWLLGFAWAGSACSYGVDNDGDGSSDEADQGCVDEYDTSERSSAIQCDDGTDNDGNLGIDFPIDPYCDSPVDVYEPEPSRLLGIAAGLSLLAVLWRRRGAKSGSPGYHGAE